MKLPDDSYSVADIKEYFDNILQKHGKKIDNPSIKKYIKKIENRIPLK